MENPLHQPPAPGARQLAAIMFTDIEGYSALMEKDEAAAFQLRNRHRQVFEAAHQTFNGKVIQYFGDGTLSIFSNSKEAVDCAIQMQKAFREAPKVPLRIGIHTGEIMVVDDDILGDSVNVASRVESIGVAGSIFISEKVYDNIKNQKEFITESMGLFEFKNIDKPKEVFAISNTGLVVPNPETLRGKTKLKDFRKEVDRNFTGILRELWERKVILVIGVYLVGLWLVLKAMQVVIDTYAVSPYWTDVLLVFFISFLPSVILHAYYHHRPEMKNWRLAEKITIPSNALLSMFMLIFLFGGKDLGAITRTVVAYDEFGNRVEKEIVKKEFRKSLVFYPFSNETGDSSLNWLGGGITWMLDEDLFQDNYLSTNSIFEINTLGAMAEHAESEHIKRFITGKFDKKDSLYIITYQLYDTKTLKIIKEKTLSGYKLFDLGDEISPHIKKDLGLSDHHIQNTKDIPIRSHLTDNLEAYRFFMEGLMSVRNIAPNVREALRKYKKADQLDPSFAHSNFYYAELLYWMQISQKEATLAITKAMKHRAREKEIYNMRIRALYYDINGEHQKALAIREMQAELTPDAYYDLFWAYVFNGDYEKALNLNKIIYEFFPEATYLPIWEAMALHLLNRNEEALAILQAYVKSFPNDVSGLGQLGILQLDMGNLDEAGITFNKISLLDPEDSFPAMVLEHIQNVSTKGALSHTERSQQLVGEFRYCGLEETVKYTYENAKLVQKNRTGIRLPLYAINDSLFISLYDGTKISFKKDISGNFYKQRQEGNAETFILYRRDSTIQKAEKLLLEGQDEAALGAYEAAYAKNPGHHFLKDYIRHLNFKKSAKASAGLSRWQRFAGNYEKNPATTADIENRYHWDGGTLTFEDGQSYWWNMPGGIRWTLLPLTANTFALQEYWDYRMKMLEQDGKVTGMEWTFPDGSQEILMHVE